MVIMTEFKEKGRIKTSDTTDVMISEVWKKGEITGFVTTKYIHKTTEDGFEGPTKGVFIPVDDIQDYLAIFDKFDLEAAIEKKGEKS